MRAHKQMSLVKKHISKSDSPRFATLELLFEFQNGPLFEVSEKWSTFRVFIKKWSTFRVFRKMDHGFQLNLRANELWKTDT